MAKSVTKFFAGAVGIVLLGALALYGAQYLRYRNSPEYRALQNLKNLEKQYAEDPYGGETPEETLRLFIEALKKGDMELASKYFVLDKQKEWLDELLLIKEKGLLNDMVRDLEKLKKTKETDNEVFYTTTNEIGVVSVQLIIGKSSYNQRWKLYEL